MMFALYSQEDSWNSILLEVEADPRAMRLEGLGEMKNTMSSSEIKPTTFQLVA
jgi:hypothetical protein